MKIRNIFKIFGKKDYNKQKKMIMEQKINSMRNDLTIMKMQLNTILSILRKMEGK